jgi:hypothetical protein
LLLGIPAVVSDRLNLAPELVQAGAAEVVTCSARGIAAAIGKLANDPMRRQALAAAGKVWVESHCSRARVGAGFVAFYESLLQ